jgi:hypothetical protein
MGRFPPDVLSSFRALSVLCLDGIFHLEPLNPFTYRESLHIPFEAKRGWSGRSVSKKAEDLHPAPCDGSLVGHAQESGKGILEDDAEFSRL